MVILVLKRGGRLRLGFSDLVCVLRRYSAVTWSLEPDVGWWQALGSCSVWCLWDRAQRVAAGRREHPFPWRAGSCLPAERQNQSLS